CGRVQAEDHLDAVGAWCLVHADEFARGVVEQHFAVQPQVVGCGEDAQVAAEVVAQGAFGAEGQFTGVGVQTVGTHDEVEFAGSGSLEGDADTVRFLCDVDNGVVVEVLGVRGGGGVEQVHQVAPQDFGGASV